MADLNDDLHPAVVEHLKAIGKKGGSARTPQKREAVLQNLAKANAARSKPKYFAGKPKKQTDRPGLQGGVKGNDMVSPLYAKPPRNKGEF